MYGTGLAGRADLKKIEGSKVTVEGSNLHVMRLPLSLDGFEEIRVRLFPSGEFELQLFKPGFTLVVALLGVGGGQVWQDPRGQVKRRNRGRPRRSVGGAD